MSFNEMLGSAKGPGVIGMIMALIVLLGFGTLFMFAFDEGGTGDAKSLAATVRDGGKQIASEKLWLASLEQKLARAPELKKISGQHLATVSINKSLLPRISALKVQIGEIRDEIGRIRLEMANYKDEYRNVVRTEATGKQIGDIQTIGGDVYKDVEVRSVSAIGMEIRHKDGFKRIPFQDLPEDMQDFYQFDKSQMEEERERESKVRELHNKAVAVANQAAGVMEAERKTKDAEVAKQKAIQEIATKSGRLRTILRDIGQLESEVRSAISAAESAKSSGRMHLSKAGPLRNRLYAKRAEYSRLETEVAKLRASH